MISFYPGPSRVHDEIPRYVADAHKKGILSINHRSDVFVEMSKKTIGLLKQKLNIPKNYTVLYTSSATECWEIITQSLITHRSYHLYNGSFGQKWFEYTKRLRPEVTPLPFDLNQKLNPRELIFEHDSGLICITQNETSNGTQVSNTTIRGIKKNNPTYLVAVDATSSMGGVFLDFKAADIWFASVQKCFGLPAGLALLILSPEAVKRAYAIQDQAHYNSLPFMLDMIEKYQTPFTPNVLNIYLLMRVMEKSKPIKQLHQQTVKRYEAWMKFFKTTKTIKPLIENTVIQSHTVIPVTSTPEVISLIKLAVKKKGILLGEGYGDYKPYTFRISNFPALKPAEITLLMTLLKRY